MLFRLTNWTRSREDGQTRGVEANPLARGEMQDNLDSRWLSLEELSAYLGIKQATAYKWIKRKGMPAHKAGRLWRFRKAEIDDWMLSGRAAMQDLDDNQSQIGPYRER